MNIFLDEIIEKAIKMFSVRLLAGTFAVTNAGKLENFSQPCFGIFSKAVHSGNKQNRRYGLGGYVQCTEVVVFGVRL